MSRCNFGSKITSIYLEKKIVETTSGAEQFLEVKLWVVESGELADQVIDYSF